MKSNIEENKVYNEMLLQQVLKVVMNVKYCS